MGEYNNNYVFNGLSELLPQVYHRILKAVSFNHKNNLDAAIEAIMDDLIVFEQLKDVFSLVDDEILKAIANEYSANADGAINEILQEDTINPNRGVADYRQSGTAKCGRLKS